VALVATITETVALLVVQEVVQAHLLIPPINQLVQELQDKVSLVGQVLLILVVTQPVAVAEVVRLLLVVLV
jgi:hypothetical protein